MDVGPLNNAAQASISMFMGLEPVWKCVAGIVLFAAIFGIPLIASPWERYSEGMNGGWLPKEPGTPVAITLRPLSGCTLPGLGLLGIMTGIFIQAGVVVLIGAGLLGLSFLTGWLENRETSHRLVEDGLIARESAGSWGCAGLVVIGIIMTVLAMYLGGLS